MAIRIFEAKEAKILTAAVEVKTITIRGKQMTQSVFRQIPVENVIDHVGRIRGTPWGLVNYYFDRCKNKSLERGHLHVVWQDGDCLKRACVELEPHWGFNKSGSKKVSDRVEMYDKWIDNIVDYANKVAAGRRIFFIEGYAEALGVEKNKGDVSAMTTDAVSARLAAVREIRSKWAAELGRALAVEAQINADYAESYATLAALPQLFIAV